MLLAMEKLISPSIERPAPLAGQPTDQWLNISVIVTSPEATGFALKTAGGLAKGLGARIRLLVPQEVPFPLPLDSPPVLLDWSEKQFREIANQSPVETVVRLYLCRDRIETMKDALSPKSVVVIGARRGWWPFTFAQKLAAELRRAGHDVIWPETE